MATVGLNELFTGLSGTIGDLVISRRGPKMVVRKAYHREAPPRPDETANRELFRLAASYGRLVQHDPAQRQAYEPAARRLHVAPYHVALKDFRHAPQLVEIDLSGCRPASPSILRVKAVDDFEVVQVQIEIVASDGTVLETGSARLDADSGLWLYDQQQLVAPGELIAVRATAFDRPQHTGTKKVLWQVGASN